MANDLDTIELIAVIMIIVSLILIIAGTVLLVLYTNDPKEWYIWFVFMFGIGLGILGAIILSLHISCKYSCKKITYDNISCAKTIMW